MTEIAGSFSGEFNKRAKRFAAIIIATFFMHGCISSGQSDFHLGKYDQVVKDVDSRGGIQTTSFIDLYYLCQSYLHLRKYDEVFRCTEKMDLVRGSQRNSLGQKFDSYLVLTTSQWIKSQAYLQLGNTQKAIFHGEKAVARAETKDFSMWDGMDTLGARSLGALGLAYALAGEKEKARNQILKLDDISNARITALVNLQIARIAASLGDFDKVKKHVSSYNDSDVAKSVLLPTGGLNDEIFSILFLKAKSYLKTGEFEKARAQYEILENIEQIKGSSGIYYQVMGDLGIIHAQLGDTNNATLYLKKSVDEIERQRSTITTEASKIGFVGDKQSVYSALISNLVKSGQFVAAFEYAERSKARALVDLLASKMSFGGRGNPKEVAAALLELDRLEKQSLQFASVESRNATRGLRLSKKNLNKQLPEVASLVSVTSEKAAAIQALLRSDEAIIEYYYPSEAGHEAVNLFAFVVTQQGITAATLTATGIKQDVQSFRTAINDYESNDWARWSTKLYDRLIEPLQTVIADKKHLTVVPHGVLHYLPFNALRGASGDFLIENHTLRLLPSASVFKFLNRKTAATNNLLVFGNPDLNDPAKDLPGAEQEARAIASLWTDSKVVLRKFASESVFKKTAGSFKYLHLASHGEFVPDEPMKSRILLAADNDNDGNLTVPEIYDLKLNAEMVVLSACQTALGEVKNGDDVVGLNRGFLYAGANSIVGSLWEVPDDATKDLMISLYLNLGSLDIREAMQKSQLEGLRKYNHPFAWAAFQVTGGT